MVRQRNQSPGAKLSLRAVEALRNGKIRTADTGSGRSWINTAPWVLLIVLLLPPLFSELIVAIAPSSLTYVLYGTTATFIQVWSFPLPRKRQLSGLLVLIGALLMLHLVPWSSRKAFLAAFHRVEIGMSVERVHSLLAPVSLSPERQTSLTARGYRHSDAPRFDSDIGLVRFTDGRVTAMEFLPD